MKWTANTKSACAFSIALLFGVAFAQEEESSAQQNGEAQATGQAEQKAEGGEEFAIPAAPAAEARVFHTLVRCKEVYGGTVEALKPRTSGWVSVEEGRFYPLGSAFRAVSTKEGGAPYAVFEFGKEATLVVTNDAEFATREVAPAEQTRTVELRGGRFSVKLPRTLRDGLFSVAAPHFICRNLAGESIFDYEKSGDGDMATVRVVTGSLALDGRHYRIARMGSANQIGIRTSADALATVLTGESGDYAVTLEQGVIRQKDFDTGENKEIAKTTDFQLSPQCAVKIFRLKSAVGGRMIVSMLTFTPSGEIKNRFTFAEGLFSVNTGEEVVVTAVKEIDKEGEAKPGEKDEKGESASEDGEEKKEEGQQGDAQSGGGAAAVETPALETPEVSF